MNSELKALLVVIFAFVQAGEDAINKSYFKLIPDLISVLSSLSGAADNFADLRAELAALDAKGNQDDLIAFLQGEFKNSSISGDKAQAIVAVSLQILQQVLGFIPLVEQLKAKIQA